MSARALPANIAARLIAHLTASIDGQPPSNELIRRLITRATCPIVEDLVLSLGKGTAARRAPDNWIDLKISPAAGFKAPNYTPGTPVDIAYSTKSGRFISTLAPSARIGLLDLLSHVWHLRAPETRMSPEVRLLALIGLAFLEALNEPPAKTSEAA
jgi:hypothetical protein